MKDFEMPEIDLIQLHSEDIMYTSNGEDNTPDDEL